ncbi:MAG: hypothetical protein V4548_01465 [Bacteroidota bacterium]
MKIQILYLFLLLNFQFPEIISNTSEQDKLDSIIYNLFNGKKTFLIAYTNECYWWSDKKRYEILAFENNKWEKIYVYSKRNKNGEWSKPKISHKSISSETANNLITELTKISFWELQNESLNVNEIKNGDGTIGKFKISDGINYKVEILQGNNFRIIESYEPEFFLSQMPEIKSRETFISGKTMIKNLFTK